MTPDKVHAATIEFGPVGITKANMQPCWKWPECIKPHAGTETFQASHIGVLMQGSMHVIQDQGSEITINAGEAYRLAPNRDAWLVGEELALGIEFSTDSIDFTSWTRRLVSKQPLLGQDISFYPSNIL